MLKKLALAGAAIAMTAATMIPSAPAAAQSRYYDGRGQAYYDGYRREYPDYRGYRDYRDYRDYRGSSYREYRGDGYRHYRMRERCNNGDGGMIIGAIAGGLLGNSVAGYGDRAVGTLLGGALGAVAGRAIDRSDRPGYCR